MQPPPYLPKFQYLQKFRGGKYLTFSGVYLHKYNYRAEISRGTQNNV